MEIFEQDDLIDFLELTHDITIRGAAWPLDEWTNAGGSLLGYGDVTNQDNPPQIKIQNSLGGLLYGFSGNTMETKTFIQDSTQRAFHIEAHKAKIKNHKVYCWLKKHDHYNFAEKRFYKIREKSKSEKILSEFAEIRFVRIIALHIGSRLLAEKVGFKRRYASSKQLKQAQGHANKLKNLLSEGVRLSDGQSQSKLNQLLEQLNQEIQLAERKPKISENFENRKCLEGVAKSMLITFGTAFPANLLDLAGVIGWLVDSSTIDRIVRQVKTNNRLALAQALRTYPHNLSKIE